MENISREFINLCKGDGYRINAVIRRPPLQEKLSLLDTMKLVDYSSDSDSNDSDDNAPSPPVALPSLQHATLPKPTKKQILVDLPKPIKAPNDDGTLGKKRPRPQRGGGGLFSVLPPPKRTKPAINGGTLGPNGDSGVGNGAVEKAVLRDGEELTPTEKETITTTAFVSWSTKQRKGAVTSAVQSSTKEEPLSLFPLGPELITKVERITAPANPSTYEPLISEPILPTPSPWNKKLNPLPPSRLEVPRPSQPPNSIPSQRTFSKVATERAAQSISSITMLAKSTHRMQSKRRVGY